MTRSKARATGAVYLLYFVLVIGATASVAHIPIGYIDAANLAANAGYVVLTLLLFQLLEPVSQNLARMLWLLAGEVDVIRWNEQFRLRN